MNLKSLGVFAMGSAFGAICMYFGMKSHFQKEADKQVAEVKEVYTYKKQDDTPATPKEEQKQRIDDLKEQLKNTEIAKKVINYSGYSANYEDEDDEMVDPAELEGPKDDDTEQDKNEPYMINVDEAGLGRSCVACTYFALDGILADNDSVPNAFERLEVSKTIGEDGLKECLDIWEDDPEEAVYFRNDKLGLDYEVLRTDTAYNEYVRAYNGVTDS